MTPEKQQPTVSKCCGAPSHPKNVTEAYYMGIEKLKCSKCGKPFEPATVTPTVSALEKLIEDYKTLATRPWPDGPWKIDENGLIAAARAERQELLDALVSLTKASNELSREVRSLLSKHGGSHE